MFLLQSPLKNYMSRLLPDVNIILVMFTTQVLKSYLVLMIVISSNSYYQSWKRSSWLIIINWTCVSNLMSILLFDHNWVSSVNIEYKLIALTLCVCQLFTMPLSLNVLQENRLNNSRNIYLSAQSCVSISYIV